MRYNIVAIMRDLILAAHLSPLDSIALSILASTYGAGVEILTSLVNDILLILNKIFIIFKRDREMWGRSGGYRRRNIDRYRYALCSLIRELPSASGENIEVEGRNCARRHKNVAAPSASCLCTAI